jgi:hypothetical protein
MLRRMSELTPTVGPMPDTVPPPAPPSRKYASSDSTAPCPFRLSVAGVPEGRSSTTVSAAEAKPRQYAAALG